jgi:hypothetical protein
MALVSLKLALIGFVLLGSWRQNAIQTRASLTRNPQEVGRTVARTNVRTIGCPVRATCRPHMRRHSHRASDLSSEESIFDSIDECSPFFSVDGSQQLEFDIESGLVTLSDDAHGLMAPASDAPLKSVGTFAADERTRQVFVRVAGENRRYTLVVPSDGEQCILAAGTSNAADLRRSWFGSVEEDPGFPDRGDRVLTASSTSS